jgi:nickel-dependent lactate racemase
VPFVLEELHAAGVADDRIFFHAAFGSHAAMSQQEMTIKLGAGVVAKYPTWNHDCFNGVQSVGTTSKGMEVKLSKRFLDAEFKICISGVKPHAMAGYGGGAKSITPGVASIDTIGHIHNILDNEYPSAVGFVTNVIRQQMEEAARLARLDMSINIVMNGEREVAGVFAGDVVDAHRSAVRMAHPNYETEIPKNMDVVITNTYPQSVEAGKEMKYFNMSLRPGGTAVLIQDTPAGQRKIHYIGWKQDSERAGLKKNGNSGLPAAQAGQMIIFCRWPSKWDQLPYSDKVYFASSWDEVLTQLGKRHGEGTKVALYPCAALQHEPIELRI